MFLFLLILQKRCNYVSSIQCHIYTGELMTIMPKANLTTQLASKMFEKCINKKLLLVNSFV